MKRWCFALLVVACATVSADYARRGVVASPPECAANGFHTLAYSSTFNSTAGIDMADSGLPGFQWYLRSQWPNAPWAGYTPPPSWTDAAFIPNDPTHLSINPVGNLYSTFSASPSGNAIASAIYSASAPGYTGNVFGPGGCFEFSMQAVNGLSSSGFAYYWYMFPVEFFTNNLPGNVFTEFDVFEDTGTATYHQIQLVWNTTTFAPDPSAAHNFNSGPLTLTNETGFHTTSMVWKTIAQNGGTNGYLAAYTDHAKTVETTYTAGDIWAGVDTQHLVVFWGNKGIGQFPARAAFFRYWTTPYLLMRDLDPAANDNSPAFLAKVG